MANTADDENIGALRQRVFGLESNQRQLVDSVQSLGSRVETLFASLSAKIEDRSRPQYTLLISLGAVGLAFITAIGGLAYAPIRESQTDLKTAIIETTKNISTMGQTIAREYVTVREVDARTQRSQTDLSRLREDIKVLDLNQVPRVEQAERFRSMDTQFVNLQRQMDDLKKVFGETYSLRDALQEMKREMDRLRNQRAP